MTTITVSSTTIILTNISTQIAPIIVFIIDTTLVSLTSKGKVVMMDKNLPTFSFKMGFTYGRTILFRSQHKNYS